MNVPNRQFTDSEAVRSRIPLSIGLVGPSGGGKTFSALRLATGIQRVVGGDIYGIDTESKRMLHYADDFKFKHVPFGEPFGSLDYLAALQYCVKKGAKVIIVDSCSHEHEGTGGMLDMHEQILFRMAGDDYKKREAMKMLAWSEPKQARRQLINGMLQLDCNFIFCFRAKDSAKPARGNNGKMEVVKMGFLPIAGSDFVFEMTLNCLLLPNANGVPTFIGDDLEQGEKMMIKLPRQFKHIFDRPNVQLTEEIGVELANWAAGTSATKTAQPGQPTQGQIIKDLINELHPDTTSTFKSTWFAQFKVDNHSLTTNTAIIEELQRQVRLMKSKSVADYNFDDPFADIEAEQLRMERAETANA